MFKRITQNIKRHKATKDEFLHGKPIDPNPFGDPLALQTEWTPIARNSGSRLKRFVQAGPNLFRTKPTPAGVVFSLGFFVLFGGMGLVLLLLFLLSLSHASNFPGNLALLFFGLLVTIPSFLPFYFTYKPMEFNKMAGHLRIGFQIPLLARRTLKTYPLESIRAVQAIKGKWSSSRRRNNSEHPNYEMNLVLENGDRINLLSNTHAEAIKVEARQLSEFLEIPIWDAIPEWMARDSNYA